MKKRAFAVLALAILFASAASAQIKSGVGILFANGTPTSWRPMGASNLNTACDPFGPDGSLAVSRFGPEWACRYTGGDIDATYATPRAGAEWEFLAGQALIEWCRQGRPLASLPPGGGLAPGAFNCTPTDRERVDLIYHPESFAFIAEWSWIRSPNREGKQADTPTPIPRPDLPWAFFTEPHVQFPVTVYFRNTARPQGEISYSPERRQRDTQGREFGPILAAYPQVFGPPTTVTQPVCGDGVCASGEQCPADCQPVGTEPTACRPFTDPLRLDIADLLDRITVLEQQVARTQRLPADLAQRLANVGRWENVDKPALQDLSKWLTWANVFVPADVRSIIADALTWQKVPATGGRRVRLQRLDDWLRGLLPTTP
ncbi:MAG TPA: hypothetical protein VMW27_30930 [Thermoanaerobaculia bacterium]|nr:hypothetical protein [Thermoanaerobaculia bacterium]